MKRIVILGSTGSIGKNALEIIRNNREEFVIIGLSANRNIDMLKKQIIEFDPKYINVGTEEGYRELKKEFPKKDIYLGEPGLKELAAKNDYEILLTAVSGAVGIAATIEAIKKEKRIALANKETMVAAGSYINKLLKKYKNAEIIPVDSEHSAIFQSIIGNKKEDINKIIITASGGSFRGKKLDELKNVTVEDALKHPNWSMGKKITIDSATLINKGLEIIEAHELFNISYDNIDVIMHPQSIIHSMVEYKDGSIIGQLGVPDMKIPIQYAFTYPDRLYNRVIEKLDFMKFNSLTFEQIDRDTFKGVDLAYAAGRIGGTMPAVLNAANEEAVELFLGNKIKFLDIYEIIEFAMSEHKAETIQNLETIYKVDRNTRELVKSRYGGEF